MKIELPTSSPAPASAAETAWVPCAFLHVGPDRIYNPLTDRLLKQGEPGYPELRELLAGALDTADLAPELQTLLQRHGWLVSAHEDQSRRYHLKYVSLEAHTVCNQACYFCPVSVDPRQDYFMPTEFYERIVREIAAYRDTIEAVFMINYNEPTVDPRFVEQVRTIKAAGLPPAALTNGTGLTPERVEQIVKMGGMRFLSVNLSTLQRERYIRDRRGDHLETVLRNVDYAARYPLAEEMDIVVLGTGNDAHKDDFEAIRERYAGSHFNVKFFLVNDRAGYMYVGLRGAGHKRKLCGCEYVGSRPLQHLHITPRGQCVLCCQDYGENWVVGDLNEASVEEVLTGPAMAQARRWTYGLEEAPSNFLCYGCRYALSR